MNSKNIQLPGDVPAKVCTALITDGKIIPPHLGNTFFNSKYDNFLSVPQSKVNYQGPSSKIWFTASLLRIKKLEKLCYQYTICTQSKPFEEEQGLACRGRVMPTEPPQSSYYASPAQKGDCVGFYFKKKKFVF